MGLLQTLCLVKMDTVDGSKPAGAAGKRDQVKTNAADSASSPTVANDGAANSCNRPNSDADSKMETEMKGETREARRDQSLLVFIYSINLKFNCLA